MNTRQGIVVVNEYTVKGSSGKGSRGSTPGAYVDRYMGRAGATEIMAPERLTDQSDYIERYMTRTSAVESTGKRADVLRVITRPQRKGGVAFSRDDISLSDQGVRDISADIQRLFDQGHTVMKTVISFDETYLEERGIVPEGFSCTRRGDFRGHIDQLKLRGAIQRGMHDLGRGYDDLRWVGVIQVDTMHVHCHLAMVDAGCGDVMPDGTQRGKLSRAGMAKLRRGIDRELDLTSHIVQMSSAVTYDRRNVVAYVKGYAHRAIQQGSFTQFLLAALPQDRSVWRAGTNRREMQVPNDVCRRYVEAVMAEPGSGMTETMAAVSGYAQERSDAEGSGSAGYRRYVSAGRERVVEAAMNGVYALMRTVPEDRMVMRTDFMDMQAAPLADVRAIMETDETAEFGYRLRTYSSRLRHHKELRDKAHVQREALAHETEDLPGREVLDRFLSFEEDYNARLMSKYQYFLTFIPRREEWEPDFDDLVRYARRIDDLDAMAADPSIARMGGDAADEYGLRVYGQRGGRDVAEAPDMIEARRAGMARRYDEMAKAFEYRLAGLGLSFDGQGVVMRPEHDFEDVKGLDLHHLAYDFVSDVEVGSHAMRTFLDATDERSRVVSDFMDYLEGTDQADVEDDDPFVAESIRDTLAMSDCAAMMGRMPSLVARRPEAERIRPRPTLATDPAYQRRIDDVIRASVHDAQRIIE